MESDESKEGKKQNEYVCLYTINAFRCVIYRHKLSGFLHKGVKSNKFEN